MFSKILVSTCSGERNIVGKIVVDETSGAFLIKEGYEASDTSMRYKINPTIIFNCGDNLIRSDEGCCVMGVFSLNRKVLGKHVIVKTMFSDKVFSGVFKGFHPQVPERVIIFLPKTKEEISIHKSKIAWMEIITPFRK